MTSGLEFRRVHEALVLHFHHAVCHLVNEVAVVRHGEDGSLVIQESVFDYFPRVNVQMIRRFVEQKEIRLVQEDFQ
mgnify:CR=1 FL=1